MGFLEIADFLEDNGLSEIKELKSENEFLVLKFYYDFDNDELEAAKAYANEESDAEEGSDEWYTDWYYSYLRDIAKDNIEDILDDMNEEFSLDSAFKILTDDATNADYIKVVAGVCSEDYDYDLDEALSEYI